MQIETYLKEVRKLIFYIIPVFSVTCGTFFFFKTVSPETAWYYCQEDGLVEWGQCTLYFFSFLIFALTYRNTKNIYILLLAIAMFFAAGEEISWGQRVFGFKTPQGIKKENVQGEFTIHNLEFLNPVNFKGEEKRGFAKLTDINFLFKIFNLLFGIAIPLCVFHFKKLSAFNQKLRIPVPPISIGIFFLLSWVSMKLSLSGINKNNVWIQEPASVVELGELNSCMAMAMIALYFYNCNDKNKMVKDIKQIYFT